LNGDDNLLSGNDLTKAERVKCKECEEDRFLNQPRMRACVQDHNLQGESGAQHSSKNMWPSWADTWATDAKAPIFDDFFLGSLPCWAKGWETGLIFGFRSPRVFSLVGHIQWFSMVTMSQNKNQLVCKNAPLSPGKNSTKISCFLLFYHGIQGGERPK